MIDDTIQRPTASITDVFPLVRLLALLGRVERTMYAPGATRHETTLEHSATLAMTAWYLVTAHRLPLDATRCAMIALMHDLVEAYAGDTYFYADAATLADKDAREAAALARIAQETADVPDVAALITAYKERTTPEARFVYALDKIEPLWNSYLDGGRVWREMGVTLPILVEHKTPRVAVSPEVAAYFEELVALIAAQEGELFGV